MVGHRGQDDSVVGQGAVLNTSTAWPARHGLREKAFNDAMMLQCAIHKLLQNSFKDDSRYDKYNLGLIRQCKKSPFFVSQLSPLRRHVQRQHPVELREQPPVLQNPPEPSVRTGQLHHEKLQGRPADQTKTLRLHISPPTGKQNHSPRLTRIRAKCPSSL